MFSRKFVSVLAILVFAFTCSFSIAQESPKTAMELFPKAVGFNSQSWSDDFFLGLNFQQWIGDFGFTFYLDTQATFLSSFQYQISKSRFCNSAINGNDFSTGLFLYADLGLTSVPFQVITGIGMGFEMVFYDHFSWVWKAGYTLLFPNTPSFNLSVNQSLQYRF